MYENLCRKLQKIKFDQNRARQREKDLKIRARNAKNREEGYNRKVQNYHNRMNRLYNMEHERGRAIAKEVKHLKDELQIKQRKRIELLLAKMEPIIIRDGPSRKTTYKLQARNLHVEIFPMKQRIRLIQMRVEHEKVKRKAVEMEVRQLRDHIDELINRITRNSFMIMINTSNFY